MAAILSSLESLTPLTGWVAVAGAVFSGVFVLYIGVALTVTLFHPDPAVRRHAGKVLRRLLNVVRRAARR